MTARGESFGSPPRLDDAPASGQTPASIAAEDVERYVYALRKIAGNDPGGLEGFHFVGDEQAPDECPGCWARWALQDMALWPDE